MKIKKEYIILVIIIISLSLYLILRNPNRTNYELPKIPDVSGKSISKIEIARTNSTIILNKIDDKWYISPEGYLADTTKVKNMLETIENLNLTALVSESKNFERYDLNNEKKINIKAWSDDTLSREFEVGKVATSYRHTFIKIAGDDRVYHARDNFRGKFDKTVDDLRDKSVLSFEQIEIQEIRITKGGESMVLSRKQAPVEISADQKSDAQSSSPPKEETVWNSADGKEIDSSITRRIIAALSNLQCEKYIGDRKKSDFLDPIYTLELKGVKEYTLSIFTQNEKDDQKYPAISSENDYPFLISKHQAENIIKLMDEILKTDIVK